MLKGRMCFFSLITSFALLKQTQKCALLGRIPSVVGYQPTLATDLGGLQERITTTKKGSITSVQAIYVLADDLTDPAPATTFAHLDATTVLSRQANKQGGNTLSTRKPFSPLAERDNIVGKQCILYGWARRLIAHGLIQSADPNLVVHGKAAGSGNLKIALTEVVDPTCQLWLSGGFHDNIGEVGVGGFVVWTEHSVEVMNG